jgi:hypothetical protein
VTRIQVGDWVVVCGPKIGRLANRERGLVSITAHSWDGVMGRVLAIEESAHPSDRACTVRFERILDWQDGTPSRQEGKVSEIILRRIGRAHAGKKEGGKS